MTVLIFFLEKPLTAWKFYFDAVVKTLNANRPSLSYPASVKQYFTTPSVVIPQNKDSLYKFQGMT